MSKYVERDFLGMGHEGQEREAWAHMRKQKLEHETLQFKPFDQAEEGNVLLDPKISKSVEEDCMTCTISGAPKSVQKMSSKDQ